jgi:eukaryotic-like serine/threonine-protein kinase
VRPGDTVKEEIRFRIEEEIGKGTYGVVFKAVQEGLNRLVAIKELHNVRSSVARLKEEAWVNGALIHPNIVSVLLFDDKKGLIIMEFVPNSLRERIRSYEQRNQRFDEEQVVDTLTQCLEALAFSYEHGCRFHGDIKPANILLTESGTIKLGDFGVSQSYRSRPSALSGSETWAAPEVLKNWVSDHVWTGDQKSDLFSLGVVAYILLTGRNPFVDPTGLGKISEYILDPNYVPRVPVTTNPNLGRVVAKLLAKELGRRYQSARQALDDIHGLMVPPWISSSFSVRRHVKPFVSLR